MISFFSGIKPRVSSIRKTERSLSMKTIPETSPEHYLSGMASLSIPSPQGTGDGHMLETFDDRNPNPLQFFAGNEIIRLLGTRGIINRSDDADRAGIPHIGTLWCATHSRAVADMMVKSFLSGKDTKHIRMHDWLDGDGFKETILMLKTIKDVSFRYWLSDKIR